MTNFTDKEHFLSPHYSYKGDAKPHYIVFDANLQTFSQKVSFISALENGGKLSPSEAFEQIKALWKVLKSSKKALLDNPDFEPPLAK